jgi:hypothetical protein
MLREGKSLGILVGGEQEQLLSEPNKARSAQAAAAAEGETKTHALC